MHTLPQLARAPLAGRGGAARGCLAATPSSTRCARKASRWCEPSTTPVAGTADASTVTTTGGRSSSQRGTGDVRATPSRFPNCGCGSRTPSHPGAASAKQVSALCASSHASSNITPCTRCLGPPRSSVSLLARSVVRPVPAILAVRLALQRSFARGRSIERGRSGVCLGKAARAYRRQGRRPFCSP